MNQQVSKQFTWSKLGYYTALCTVILTVITFSIAILTPPLAGPWCQSGCFEYPYLEIASRFPRDYYWMYPSMLLSIIVVVLIACIHQYVVPEKKVFSLLALLFVLVSSSILAVDYFIQVTVIQPSLLNDETDGISLLTQYNPHGIFIALEEFGYLMLSLALFCAIPVFSKSKGIEKAIRITFFSNFLLSVLALILISVVYGIHREYRFEIAVISINWLTLIVSGILLCRFFRRHVPRELTGETSLVEAQGIFL
jgi:hypothetical protein